VKPTIASGRSAFARLPERALDIDICSVTGLFRRRNLRRRLEPRGPLMKRAGILRNAAQARQAHKA